MNKLQVVGSFLLVVLRDGAALAGGGATVYGVYQIFEPAAWIYGGLLLMIGAFIVGRR